MVFRFDLIIDLLYYLMQATYSQCRVTVKRMYYNDSAHFQRAGRLKREKYWMDRHECGENVK